MKVELTFPDYAKTIINGEDEIIGWIVYDSTPDNTNYGGIHIIEDYRNRGYGAAALDQVRDKLTRPMQLIGTYPIEFLTKTGCVSKNGAWYVLPRV